MIIIPAERGYDWTILLWVWPTRFGGAWAVKSMAGVACDPNGGSRCGRRGAWGSTGCSESAGAEAPIEEGGKRGISFVLMEWVDGSGC
jgi:hypothetical protein